MTMPENLKKSVRDLVAKLRQEELDTLSNKPTKEMWTFLLGLRNSGAYNMIDPSVANLLASSFDLSTKKAEDIQMYYCLNYQTLMCLYGDLEDPREPKVQDLAEHNLAHELAHSKALDKAVNAANAANAAPASEAPNLAACHSPSMKPVLKTCPGAPKKKSSPSKKVRFFK